MAVTTHWLPFNRRFHTGLRSLQPCYRRNRYEVLLRARDAKGTLLEEHRLNQGEPVTGASSLLLDFSVFDRCMQEAGEGMVEAHFSSEEPFLADGCNYYFGSRGFTTFVDGPKPSFNAPGKTHRYRGFSVHLVNEDVAACGVVLMNMSSDPAYSRTATLQYEILDRKGEIARKDIVEVPPFGTRWLGLDEAFLGKQETMYTVFGQCDGSAMISLIYTFLKGGSLGIDHTQPPLAQQWYGEDLQPSLLKRTLKLRKRFIQKARLLRRVLTG